MASLYRNSACARQTQVRSPERAHGIPLDVAVRSDDHETVGDRLADQHTVERVPMERRKPGELKRRFLVQRQTVDAVSIALCRDEPVDRLRQRQSPQRVLDGDLPCRDGAQEHLVCGINDRLARPRGQLVGIRDEPEEGDGIEQEPHPPFASKASSRSRGSGLKNAADTRSAPFAKPTGRGFVRSRRTGRSSATGALRWQTRKVSPRSTSSRYRERCVLASWMLILFMSYG